VRPITIHLLVLACAACASTPRHSKSPAVAVYEADPRQPVAQRAMPEGCRLIGTSGSIDQMESERASGDPYRQQRGETAERGGNVLLALSETVVNRPTTDCPSNDTSPDCLKSGQSWYRVRFEEYACSPEATSQLAALPAEPRRGGITVLFGSPKKAAPSETLPPSAPRAGAPLSPAELKTKVMAMMSEHVAPEVILTYVRGQPLTRRLTAEEIIDWTRAGIPDAAIESAASR
jgi:hypothetical protein